MTDGIYILLGSNQGDKRKNINDAKKLIRREAGKILKESSIYKTAAWGKENQPDFLNKIIEIETNFNPDELLELILNLENKLGRTRRAKWEERIIDIDIIYYSDLVVDKPNLKIPHPELQNRRFTLVPLVEIAPEFTHPVFNKYNYILLSECLDYLDVTKITNLNSN